MQPDFPQCSANPLPTGSQELSVYLHVPFCVSRCIYCDFYVVLEKSGGKEAYVEALCREIEARFAGLQGYDSIGTLYVGGGTPSLLPAAAYRRIFEAIRAFLPLAPQAEITFEANPGGRHETMADTPEAYLEAGFNRISVGVQSLVDGELQKLSRVHTAAEAEAFVRRLQTAGWPNISIDLMYAVPGQTLASWRHTLDRAVALGVRHISMYGLKVEEGTALERLLGHPTARGAYALPDEEANVAMYFEALNRLGEAGFQRYEFSNLARPGFESRHNLNYWNNGEYLALGVSAHGYLHGQRYETVRDLSRYLADPLAGEVSPCPPETQLENAIIFGLRKAEGIRISALEAAYGIDFQARYGHIVRRFSPDYLRQIEDRLVLTDRAIPLSNAILAEFLN